MRRIEAPAWWRKPPAQLFPVSKVTAPILDSTQMARFRLAHPAPIDLANILSTSAERWGAEGRRRYVAMLVAGQIASDLGHEVTGQRSHESQCMTIVTIWQKYSRVISP